MKPYLALKASAGSGKTFALTVRYITLLLLGAKPNEILTLTFTNKAANEMSERIFHTLQTLGDDEAYLDSIVKESGLSKEIILGKKNSLLKLFVSSELSIFTIDKFVNKILREFCGYIALGDDFEIKQDDIDDLGYKFLQSLELDTFDKLIDFSLYEDKKLNSLFSLFKLLIEKNEKFEVIHIEENLVNLQKRNALTEAMKIKEFILNCPVASNAAKKAVDYDDFPTFLTKSKSWLAKDAVNEYTYFKKCANDLLQSHFLSLKQEVTNYYKLRANYSLSKLFELFTLFKNYKEFYNKRKNYLEFSDISNFVYELLTSSIDREFLYFRLDSKFSHMLIDEFQDTSTLQFKILEPLIEEILSGNETEFKSFFYVGDTKQSIYRFRGGKKELFDHVSKVNPLVEVEVLNTNYRSSKNVVEFVNKSFEKLRNYEYHPQLSIKPNGYVEVIIDGAFEEDDKFVNIASKIAELLRAGIDANDIAILTYTNDDVLSLYSYLSVKFPKLKITTEMTSKLINQENVSAVINYIKYLYFKEDIYKENFNAIVGNDLFTKLDISFDIKKLTVQSLIKQIATRYKLVDDNIVKFVELSSGYFDIVDFIYNIDKSEAIMENKEQSGLQILTIFKSKGLEFDTVILLDRIKKKTPDRSSLLYEYDDVELKNVYYKISNLENFDLSYKNALQKEKDLTIQDEKNILYVAMTRAKSNLFIFKKAEKSVFDLLDLKVEVIGNLQIKEKIIKPKDEVKRVEYTPLDLGKQDKSISNESEDIEATLYSKYFGIATHYCLEMMKDFSEDSLQRALSQTISRYSEYLEDEDFKDIKDRVILLLQNKDFSSLLEESSFTTEQSLIYNNEVRIIDLLIEKNSKYFIIDYKTTKDEQKAHLNQVSHYIKAIKEIFDTDDVKGYVVYLQEDKCYMKEV